MKEILLTSEKFVKDVTSISDNIAGKYLLPAIREAQDITLREIIGGALLKRLKLLVDTDAFYGDFNYDFNDDFFTAEDIEALLHYKAVIERAQYYLAYRSVAELTMKVSYKIANIGVSRTNDENVQAVSLDEVKEMRDYYNSKADFYCLMLERFLCAHASLFPELTEAKCYELRANLRSAATCGVWLGGARGKWECR